jgi:endonuclease/exonuclease/phosphatase family metal-dependent hydrolase
MEPERECGAPPPGGDSTAATKLSAFPRGNKRKTLWCLVALLFVGVVGWHASLRTPTGPAAGGPLGLPGQAAAEKSTFRIGTFNIHSGRGSDGRWDLARTAKAMADLDFVGLNEVAGRWPWQAADQAEVLGRLTGRACLFAPFERRWYCYQFGNGLLAGQPIRDWRRIPLSGGSDRPRSAVLATVGDAARSYRAIVVHASRRDEGQRREEFRAVFALFQATREPVVLLGDLNAGRDDPQLGRLLATPGVVDALACSPEVPRQRIDWILLRGLRAVRAGMVDQGASDHPLFWAEVQFAEGVQ